jgi:hypothetical protein
LTARNDYLAVKGMDETRFPVHFHDVDLCLKLRALGKRVVMTPYARLSHIASTARSTDPAGKMRFDRELQNLRAKWADALIADPYYSPILSLDPVPFSALAWPPRVLEPRVNAPPNPATLPPGY